MIAARRMTRDPCSKTYSSLTTIKGFLSTKPQTAKHKQHCIKLMLRIKVRLRKNKLLNLIL